MEFLKGITEYLYQSTSTTSKLFCKVIKQSAKPPEAANDNAAVQSRENPSHPSIQQRELPNARRSFYDSNERRKSRHPFYGQSVPPTALRQRKNKRSPAAFFPFVPLTTVALYYRMMTPWCGFSVDSRLTPVRTEARWNIVAALDSTCVSALNKCKSPLQGGDQNVKDRRKLSYLYLHTIATSARIFPLLFRSYCWCSLLSGGSSAVGRYVQK